MKFLFPVALFAFVFMGLVSCDKCDEVSNPTIEGYGDANVVIDALEGDTIEVKTVTANDYVSTWHFPDKTTRAGDVIVIGPVDESIEGVYRLVQESDKCIKETEFKINYIDLTPECDLELGVLKSRNKKDSFTYTSTKVTPTEEADGVISYLIKFGAQSSMTVKFNEVPVAGRYILSGTANTDASEKNSVGMFFDFGISNQYEVPAQAENYVFVRRVNGVLKMKFCDIDANNTDREDTRQMSMEVNLD